MGNKKNKESFVHVHCHSDFSQLDGCAKVSDYVAEAKRRGNPAISVTDHGTMRGYLQLRKECEKHDIKPIYGIEFYVSPDMHRKGLTEEERADVTKGLKKSEHRKAVRAYEEEQGIRDRWHTTCWAINNEGMKNLQRLSSLGFTEGFYYKPRIDLKTLCEYNDGIAVSTGCVGGPAYDLYRQGKKRFALNFVDTLHETFGDRFFIEVQPHGIEVQRTSNKIALKFRDRTGAKLIAGQDSHYLRQEDYEIHDVLLCIGTNSYLDDPNRFTFPSHEFYFKTKKEMYQSFLKNHKMSKSLVLEALNSTVELADMCNVNIEIDYKKALLPNPGIPEKYKGNNLKYLKDLCLQGWTWREIPRRAKLFSIKKGILPKEAIKIYADRLKMELKTLHKLRFIPYFFVVQDIYKFARKSDIFPGPGRGSAGGSLVAYLIGITSVDPIEHGLIFERFINPDRNDYPDIDMDFEDARRREIIDYIIQKYGRENVCQISTVGRLSGKSVFRDVSRVLRVPLSDVNTITNSIISRPDGHPREYNTIEDSFESFKIFNSFDKKYPLVKKYASRLEGMAKTIGIHAAGVIASPIKLTDIIPIESRNYKGETVMVSAIDMKEVESVGLIKLDVLGLRTLTVIKNCLNLIKERHGENIDMEKIDMNDSKILELFTQQDFSGVFQYDTPSAYNICKDVVFEDFEDIAALTALNRPGATRSGLAEKYLSRKKDPKLRDKIDFHPMINNICNDTLGVIVYQEHCIRIFTDLSGFTPGKADILRKAIGKKKAEVLKSARTEFVDGCKNSNNIDSKLSNKIFSAIEAFGAYGFNKCISGDTIVIRGGGMGTQSPEISVKELYNAQNGKTSWGQKIRRGKLSILQMDNDGRIRPGLLKKIHYNGIRKTFSITTSSGRKIVVTSNHKLLTDRGYFRVDKMTIGTKLVCIGEKNRYIKIGRQTNRAIGKKYKGRKGGIGVPHGNENPSYIDGRTLIFQKSKQHILERSKGKCEHCNENPGSGNHDFEFAHINSLTKCKGDFHKYHNHKNVRLLCNSCHKKFDYQKGERKKRWSRGVETIFEEITSIKYSFYQDVYDIEMDTEEHNFVANGIVSHNSHATEYAAIGYWCQYLKGYYGVEFYWSLLKNEPDHNRIKSIAKDAKKHRINTLSPHVNFSKDIFSIDPDGNIRGSLMDIKGVGIGAAKTVMQNQPFSSFIDFYNRIDKRKCNRGAVTAMIKAGAMSDIIPNQKYFEMNLANLWKIFNRKKNRKELVKQFWIESKSVPDYSEEDKMLIASQVNPLAFGENPLQAYLKFMKEHIGVELTTIVDSDEFWEVMNGKAVYTSGLILDQKKNQIGDYHTGDLPSEQERAKMFWGKRYANVNIEGDGQNHFRAKFDIDIYEDHVSVLDAGSGTPIILHGTIEGRYRRLKVHFCIDLERYRQTVLRGDTLDYWCKIVSGQHPVKDYAWRTPQLASKKRFNVNFLSYKSNVFTGIVTHVKLKYDSAGNQMAFFGVLGDNTYIDVISFSSYWESIRQHIKKGLLISIPVETVSSETYGMSHFFKGGKLKIYRKIDGWNFK